MKGLFDEEGRKKAAHVVVYGSEPPPFVQLQGEVRSVDESQGFFLGAGSARRYQRQEVAHSPQAIERRIEELLRRISKKVQPIGGN